MQKPIVLHLTPSLMVGGAEKLLVDLLKAFQEHPRNRYEHQVAYFQVGPFLQILKQLEIKTYHIQGLINHYDPLCFWRLLRLIAKLRPKTIHAMLWTANFYARLIGKILKIPTICAIHSNHNSGNLTHDNVIKYLIDKYTLRWSTKIIVVSKEIEKKYRCSKYRLAKNKLLVINNGVKLPTTLAQKKANRPFTIGHVGRFVPVKNQQLLIRALSLVKAQFSNFKAVIIGHGPLENKLKELAIKLDLTENILFIKTNRPESYYHLFDCFVLPSHHEGQSIALLEAMSYKIVPIITQQNLNHEIVKHLYNGLVCPPNNPYSLAQSIMQLYKDPSLKSHLSQQAAKTIKINFNLKLVTSHYLTLYELRTND